jgi:polysaccharide chain length determinant protein (PEP-CTERM system associated)
MIPKDGLTIDYALAAFRRRFWYVVIPFFVVFMTAIVYCIKAPKLYRSTSLILIQPQEVPADYVKSTVTSDVSSRINSITDEVLSRSALRELIEKFDLYPKLKASGKMDEAIETLRKTIAIKIKEIGAGRGTSPSSFEVSFEGREPRTARDVTANLANLYVDYNYRIRAEQAAGTLQFLDRELERVRETLRQKEEMVRQFKEKHDGLLPEQMENNSRILAQLQQQLDSINTSLERAEDRKVLLQTQSSSLRALQPGAGGQTETPTTLEGLRQELQRLQSRYSDKHPDVIRIKRLIAAAEKGEQTSSGHAVVGETAGSGRTTDTQRLISVQQGGLSTQLRLVEREILALRQEKEKTRSEVQDYRRRIEAGPKVEQLFVDLRRDYQQASDNYQSLLQRKMQAQLAENLERTQKGEQFKILDAANLPRTPSKPDVRKILPVGLMAALGCSFGLAFLLEHLDRAFWSRKEVEGVLGIPLLVTVPFIQTAKDLQKRKVRLAGTVCALCIMGSALLIALLILWKTSRGLILPS